MLFSLLFGLPLSLPLNLSLSLPWGNCLRLCSLAISSGYFFWLFLLAIPSGHPQISATPLQYEQSSVASAFPK